MNVRCPRCGEPLHATEVSVPAFCESCGLPQIRVTPDSLNLAASEAGTAESTSVTNWGRALWMATCAACLGVGLPSLLPGSIVNGVVAGLCVLLMPVLAMLLVLAYSRSQPRRTLAPAEGGAAGALLGLLMGGLLAFTTGLTGFVLRYIRHSHAMDDRITQAMAPLPAQMDAAGAIPGQVLGLIHSPQFRAGFFILTHLFSALLLIAVGSLCGWASATVLHGRRKRTLPTS